MKRTIVLAALFCSMTAFAQVTPQPGTFPEPMPADFAVHDFQFKTGDHADVRIHYYTIGSP
jgi:hypothetical protein